MKTLHLMTQDDQPYGSKRRCCERCGLMLVARPDSFWDEHAWTHEPEDYKEHAPYMDQCGYTPCRSESKEKLALIRVKWNPPLEDRYVVPGMREDKGGWVFRIWSEDGEVLVGGTSHSDLESTLTRAVRIAKEKGYTYYRLLGAGNVYVT